MKNFDFTPDEKITMNIPDPNLYLEIQNFIEEQTDHHCYIISNLM